MGLRLTRELAYASGQDAGNAAMRKGGRSRWNEDDANIAAEVTNRLMVWGGFLPAEAYEALGFGIHPMLRNAPAA